MSDLFNVFLMCAFEWWALDDGFVTLESNRMVSFSFSGNYHWFTNTGLHS